MSNELELYPPHISREENFKNAQAEETVYSKREWDLRVLFIDQYVKDWNQMAAAMRCGFNKDAAREVAQQYLDEPAVQKLLDEFRLPPWLSNGKTEAERQVLSLLWREANYFGFGSTSATRISAANSIGKYLKMDPAHKEVKAPELIDNQAFKSLSMEEQQAFAITLRKIAVGAKE